MRKLAQTVSDFLALIGCGAILLTAVLAVGNALIRGATGMSLYGANELFALTIFVGIAACFPLAMFERAHMRVTIVGDALRPGLRNAIELFAAIATAMFLMALCWQAGKRTLQIVRYGEISEIAGIPLAPWWSAAVILLGFAVPMQIYVIIETFLGFQLSARKETPRD